MKNKKYKSCFFNFWFSFELTLLLLTFSCESPINEIETSAPVELKAQAIINTKAIKPLVYTKKVNIYEYHEKDSVLNGEIWFQGDSIIRVDGLTHFYVPMPFENWDYVISQLNADGVLETFTENICEVGGNSAWNKYFFTFDSLNKPIEIKHYKAWWYEGLIDSLGNEKKRKKYPEYFLSKTVSYVYSNNYEYEKIVHHEYGDVKVTEKFYDIKGRLLFEIYRDSDEHRKNFYTYLK